MNTKRLGWGLLVVILGCVGVRLPAQQSRTYRESIQDIRTQAEKGDALGQFKLGNCYHNGDGVVKDFGEAAKWFRKAAEQGHAKSQYNLGNCFEKGEGVPKDEVEAAKWMRKAAEQGFAYSEYRLGICYFYGQGVAKDYVEAHKWMNLAAAQGEKKAKADLRKVELLMSREDIAKAQRLAQEFKPRQTSGQP
jgi:TPR repeat protein